MLRCNDIALSVDDRCHVTVKGSTAQRNAWSAWHVGYVFKQKKNVLDMVYLCVWCIYVYGVFMYMVHVRNGVFMYMGACM